MNSALAPDGGTTGLLPNCAVLRGAMSGAIGWGEPALRWIAARRTPALTAIFLAFTALGTEPFLLLFVSLGLWLGRKRVFARAGVLLLVNGLLNRHLKELVREPRPAVDAIYVAGGWSFPSGHAQIAAALWGWLAYEADRRSVAASCLLTALLVAASRPYLGVHYPHDVLAGLVVGGATVLIAALALRHRPRSWTRLPVALRIALALGAVVAWVALLLPRSGLLFGAKMAAALAGVAPGIALERTRLDYRPPATLAAKLSAALIGSGGLILLWLGVKQLFVATGLETLGTDALRYELLGLWITYGAPRLIQRSGLAPADAPLS